MRLFGGCICEGNTFLDEGDKASSAPALSVLSKCCVSGQFGSVMS